MAMRDKLAIGVDFGTTYSGVAYIPIQSVGMQLMGPIQLGSWPGRRSAQQSFKVPTMVAYPSDPGLPPLWGFSAERRDQNPNGPNVTYTRVRAFKTCLEPENAGDYSGPAGTTAEGAVHDFLQGVYAHLVQELEIQGYSTRVVDYDVLFTVPAPFSNMAVETFRGIVMSTGWANHPVQVEITEPEAAALYTLRTQPIMRSPSMFQAQQCFVVCDAGGGTVDLASYTITSLSPNISVEQTGVVTGDVCGSTFIDKAFGNCLRERLGQSASFLLGSEKDSLMDAFIVEKERFEDAIFQDTINIKLPRNDLYCPGSKGGFLQISREEMRGFFEEPVRRTCELVGNHIQECERKGYRVSYLFLVGGFGTSAYLKARLEQWISQIDPYIRIIRPPDAQQSVVLGCLYTQLQRLRKEPDPVRVRLCRLNIGLLVSTVFNASMHFENERYKDPLTDTWMARDQILWLARKGDRIEGTTTQAIDKNLMRTFKHSITSEWTERLVYSSADVPPSRLQDGVNALCNFSSDLRNCPKGDFEWVTTNTGFCGFCKKGHYKAMYYVRILVGTADIKFEMWFQGRVRNDLMTIGWDVLDARAR